MFLIPYVSEIEKVIREREEDCFHSKSPCPNCGIYFTVLKKHSKSKCIHTYQKMRYMILNYKYTGLSLFIDKISIENDKCIYNTSTCTNTVFSLWCHKHVICLYCFQLKAKESIRSPLYECKICSTRNIYPDTLIKRNRSYNSVLWNQQRKPNDCGMISINALITCANRFHSLPRKLITINEMNTIVKNRTNQNYNLEGYTTHDILDALTSRKLNCIKINWDESGNIIIHPLTIGYLIKSINKEHFYVFCYLGYSKSLITLYDNGNATTTYKCTDSFYKSFTTFVPINEMDSMFIVAIVPYVNCENQYTNHNSLELGTNISICGKHLLCTNCYNEDRNNYNENTNCCNICELNKTYCNGQIIYNNTMHSISDITIMNDNNINEYNNIDNDSLDIHDIEVEDFDMN